MEITSIWSKDSPSLYRLGDAFLHSPLINYRTSDKYIRLCKAAAVSARRSCLRHPDLYEDTILYTYLKNQNVASRRQYLGIVKMRKLIASYLEDSPASDELVLHLRMGDKAMDRDGQRHPMDYADIIKNFSKVTVVTGFHVAKTNFSKAKISCEYKKQNDIVEYFIECIKNIFKVEVSLRSKSPDSDFCFLSRAKHLCLSNSGFSLAAALCSESKVYMIDRDRDFIFSKNKFITDLSYGFVKEEDISSNVLCLAR